MPDQLNHHGNVLGGEILALIDKCGGVVARRHVRMPTDYVEAHGRLAYVGRTSMEVVVTGYAENVETGVRRRTNTCFLTWVALDRLNGRRAAEAAEDG